MKNIFTLFIPLFTFGCLFGMEINRQTIIFENETHKKIEIPTAIVRNVPALQTAYAAHELGSSIGTRGHVRLYKPELQNFDLIKECLQYNNQQSEEIKQALAAKLEDIPHLIKVMEMTTELHMSHVSKTIAQMIGVQFQTAKKRCEAFKDGQLESLNSKPEILNLIGQAIIEPTGAKYYWFAQVKAKNYQNLWGLEQQLNNNLSPQLALVLLDAYENKVKGTSLSYAPGNEIVAPKMLREFLKPTFADTWKQVKPVYKWSLAGLGIASLAAAGYGFWNWYTSK